MASEVGICNRGLQILGAARIVSLTEDTKNARECNTAYEPLRDAELRRHPWSFAVARAKLAPNATGPVFGPAYQYTLPADCLRILPNNEVDDWQIEGRNLLTDDGATLELRYVQQVVDPNIFDALFREALSARIAYELCERITQSNTKKQAAKNAYQEAVAAAKKANAIERVSADFPEDPWLAARR